MDNTAPNPSLRRPPLDEADTGSDSDGNSEDGKAGGENRGEPEYLPAFMLSDWSMERAGRGARKLDSLACELKYETHGGLEVFSSRLRLFLGFLVYTGGLSHVSCASCVT